MARISISLPDSLIARLEPLKDGINVSQLCREALEQRVAAYERASGRDGQGLDMEALVKRLRDERELLGGKFEQLGKDNAALWLNTASYLEIQGVAEADRPGKLHKYRLPRAAFTVMKQDMQEAALDCDGTHAVVYKTAWLDYVKAVWAEVVGRVEEPDHVQVTEDSE